MMTKIACFVCMGDIDSEDDDYCHNSKTCFSGKHMNSTIPECMVPCPYKYSTCRVVEFKTDDNKIGVSRFCSKTKHFEQTCKNDQEEPDPEDEDFDDYQDDESYHEICYKDCNSTACNGSDQVSSLIAILIALCFLQ